MRTRILICLLAATATLAACSDDGNGKDSLTEKSTSTTEEETTTETDDDNADGGTEEVATALEEGYLAFTPEEAECLADLFVDTYGEQDALTLAQSQDEPIPEDKLEDVAGMIADCMDSESYAESVLAAFYGSEDAVPQALSECVGDGIGDGLAATVIEANTSDIPEEFVALVDGCLDPADYEVMLTSLMEEFGYGADSECMAQELAPAIGFAEFVQETSVEPTSAEFDQLVATAETTCGVAG